MIWERHAWLVEWFDKYLGLARIISTNATQIFLTESHTSTDTEWFTSTVTEIYMKYWEINWNRSWSWLVVTKEGLSDGEGIYVACQRANLKKFDIREEEQRAGWCLCVKKTLPWMQKSYSFAQWRLKVPSAKVQIPLSQRDKVQKNKPDAGVEPAAFRSLVSLRRYLRVWRLFWVRYWTTFLMN